MDSPARASATPLSPPRRQRRSGRLSKGRRRLLIALLGLLTVGIALYSIDRLLAHTLCRGGSWSGAPSDHFDGKRFHNVFPGTAVIHGTGSGFKWLFGMSERGLYPRVSENAYRPELAPSVDGPDWECTMVNHSTMLIRTAGLNILTDPVWSDYVSPVQGVGPARHRPPGIVWEDLPPIDICLLTHDHYDHFDAATLRRLRLRDNPLFIVPLGLRALLEYHIGPARIEERDWWESVSAGKLSITLTPAHHWSNRYRGSSNHNLSLWCGYWLESLGGPRICYVGDTAASPAFEHIRRRLGAPDLALIPIGAYRPDWLRHHHVSPDEAVDIFLALRAKQALGCHFGTWQLGHEGYDETLIDLSTALHRRGIRSERFIAAENGRSFRGRVSERHPRSSSPAGGSESRRQPQDEPPADDRRIRH